jgi:hypothetical protein
VTRLAAFWCDHNDACFIVKDANGLAVAYLYYEEEPAGAHFVCE